MKSPLGRIVEALFIAVALLCLLAPIDLEFVHAQDTDAASVEDSESNGGEVSADSEKLPPPLKKYKGRKIAPVMTYEGADWLTRSTRIQEENPQKLMDALAIKPGQTICDLGCGNGYYTLELARLVGPTGKVFAVDIQPEMLRLLESRAGQNNLKNIQLILNTPTDPKLPANSVDLILVVDVYHELSYPEHMLKALRKSLKPDGRIVLVEFRGEDPTVPIKPLHKMTKKQVRKELEPNGFKLVEEFDELPWQHVMFFGRASQEETAAAIKAEEDEQAEIQRKREERAKAKLN